MGQHAAGEKAYLVHCHFLNFRIMYLTPSCQSGYYCFVQPSIKE